MDQATILSLEQFLARTSTSWRQFECADVVAGLYGDRVHIYKNSFGGEGTYPLHMWNDFVQGDLSNRPPHLQIVVNMVTAERVACPPRRDGCSCNRCKDFVPMSEPNMPDGTFRCYSCRANPYR